jgi:hypothetical protein
MPTGPKGQRRPADVIGNAIRIAQIATGEQDDTIIDDGKDPAAKALGAKGGRKRAENMTPERRAEIAKNAAAKRWGRG